MADNSANYPPVLKDLIAKRMERAKTHEQKMAKAMTKKEQHGTTNDPTQWEKMPQSKLTPLPLIPYLPKVKSKAGRLRQHLLNKTQEAPLPTLPKEKDTEM